KAASITTPLISITLPTLPFPPFVLVWSGMGLLERRFRVMAPGAEAPAERGESTRGQARSIRQVVPLGVERGGHPGRVVERSDVRGDAVREHPSSVPRRATAWSCAACPRRAGSARR